LSHPEMRSTMSRDATRCFRRPRHGLWRNPQHHHGQLGTARHDRTRPGDRRGLHSRSTRPAARRRVDDVGRCRRAEHGSGRRPAWRASQAGRRTRLRRLDRAAHHRTGDGRDLRGLHRWHAEPDGTTASSAAGRCTAAARTAPVGHGRQGGGAVTRPSCSYRMVARGAVRRRLTRPLELARSWLNVRT
jgi:hypothetical protein